jgi:hypothetical protein
VVKENAMLPAFATINYSADGCPPRAIMLKDTGGQWPSRWKMPACPSASGLIAAALVPALLLPRPTVLAAAPIGEGQPTRGEKYDDRTPQR